MEFLGVLERICPSSETGLVVTEVPEECRNSIYAKLENIVFLKRPGDDADDESEPVQGEGEFPEGEARDDLGQARLALKPGDYVEVCRNGIPYPAKVTTIPHLDGGCLVVGVIYLGSTAGEKQALAFLTPLRRVGDAG